ncbi:uncharacterized protein PV07_01479, partial [Cladophialophora immunda]
MLDFSTGPLFDDDPAVAFWDFSAGLEPLLSSTETRTEVSRRRIPKSYNGCITCRQRKIKCDERRPFCGNCERTRHYQCQGYLHDTHSAASPRHGQNAPHKRAKTAHTAAVNLQDFTRKGEQRIRHATHVPSPGSRLDQEQSESRVHNDASRSKPAEAVLTTSSTVPDQHGDNADRLQASNSTGYLGDRRLVPDDRDTDLLAYFQNTICPIMLPSLDAVRNPWLQIYMPMALRREQTRGRAALRHALMSVAASHLTHRDERDRARYQERAKFHQDKAIKILTSMLLQDMARLKELEKCTILAAALALITTHIWGRDERSDCYTFLNLAKRLAHATGGESFWKSSVLSCILLQLLRAYDLVAATAQLQAETDAIEEDWFGADSAVLSASPTNNIDEVDRPDDGPSLSSGDAGSCDGRDGGPSQNIPYILDTSFGISAQTMTLLHELIRLRSSYESNSQPPSLANSVFQATDALAKRLYAVDVDDAAFRAQTSLSPILTPGVTESALFDTSSIMGDDQERLPRPVMEEVMENYQWAFHHAVVLYFHRVVPPSLFSLDANAHRRMEGDQRAAGLASAAREDCQELVRRLFDRLENIDCLTAGTKVRPSIALWPAFIAAAEAVDVDSRHRALIWFAKAAKRGIGNIPRAKDIVMATWRATDRRIWGQSTPLKRGLSPVDWRMVMKNSGTVIMLA